MATIHVNRGATSLGAFPEEQVREGIRAGRFLPSDLGWREGMASWQPLSQFAEFGGDFVEGNQRIVAMLTDQTRVPHITGQQRQNRRAATGRFHVGRGRSRETLQPDLAFVPELPISSTGKLLRRELRRQVAEANESG